MTTIDGKSPNLAHETTATIHDLLMEPAIRERLAQICPDAFCDGDLQMDLLLEAMGKYHTTEDIKELVVDENERYEFRWSGKQKAKYESQKSSTGTLRPCPEESKNWDTTQNLYIEGDNLEVLKILKRAYAGKIKMIYIDPPYNTGKDFVYKDDYTDNLKNYLEQTGQLTAEGKAKSSNTAADGRFHTNWLNMMYPRLRLARELLSDDGVIFISIDDHEVENLKKICDEVFGSYNYRNMIMVRRRTKSLNNQFADKGLNSLNVGYEQVIVYAKTDVFLMNAIRMKKDDCSEKGRWDVFWSNADRPTMRYEILGFTPSSGQWRNSKEKAEQAITNYKKYISDYSSKMTLEEYSALTGITDFIRRIPDGYGKNGGVQHWIAPSDTMLRTSNWLDIEVSQISKEIDLPFDNPKNKLLLMELIKLVPFSDNDIMLDFFSGSATTSHAAMNLNLDDNIRRKTIMVQLPEIIQPIYDKKGNIKDGETNNNAIAFLDSIHRPHNLCEIGKERIRRAGEKIIEDAKKAGKDVSGLDVGFKVFKLSESNMNKWHLELADLKDKNDMEKAAIAALRDSKNTIRRREIEAENAKRQVAGLAPFDIDLCVIYEWLLKYGVMPDCRITTAQIGGHKVYSVSGGAFMICLEHGLNRDWAKSLVTYRDECLSGMDEATKSDAWHVMVADECFDDTRDMQNVYKTLHDAGLKDEHWIVV